MTPWAPLLVLTGLLMVNGQAAPSGSAATTDYGFTINMKLPYPPELADKNSPQFTDLSNRIKPHALQLLQTLLPDCAAVTVSSFLRFFPPNVGFIVEPPPEEGSVLAKCLATFPNDNHTDEEVQRVFDQIVINNSSMLGDIEVLFNNPSTAAPPTSPSTAPPTSPSTAPPTSPSTAPPTSLGTAPPTSPSTAPPTSPSTAPPTSSGNKPGRKAKRPYPRRTARSRTRPRTSTSESTTTSRPSTANVWSRSTTSASNNTERSTTGSQSSMEGSSVTAEPSTVRVTGIPNTVGSDITNIPTVKSNPTGPEGNDDTTVKSNPTGPQNNDDTTVKSNPTRPEGNDDTTVKSSPTGPQNNDDTTVKSNPTRPEGNDDTTVKSNPTGPQNTEDVTLTSTSTDIISSTTLRNPRTFPPSGEVFAATVQFKVENLTMSDNMETFNRIVEDQLLKVFESNPDFISAQVALLRQGSVYVISILYFLHRAPSNQAIADVLSKFLKENNMYLGPFKIDLRSIRSGDAVQSDLAISPSPGWNSKASSAITRSTDTGGEPGISGSQGSGMGTGPTNGISTTSPNESLKSTPGAGGPSVPGVTVPSTTHDAIPSDHETTTSPGSNSEASPALTRSTVTSKSGGEPGISGSQGSGMGTGPTNGVSTTGLNESLKSTPGIGGVTVPSTTRAANMGSKMISRTEITTISRLRDTEEPGISTGSPSNNMHSTGGSPRQTTEYSNGVSSTGPKVILNTQSGASAFPRTTGSLNSTSTNPSVTLKNLSETSSTSASEDATGFPSAVSINSSGLPESVKTTGSLVMSTNPSVTLMTPSGASGPSVHGDMSTNPIGSLKTPSEVSRPSVHVEMTRSSNSVSTNPSDLPESQKTTRSSVVSPNPNVSFKTLPGASDPSVAGETTGSSSDVSPEPVVSPKTPSPPGSENTTRPSSSTVSSTEQSESLKTPSGSTGHPGSGGTSGSSSNNVSSTHESGASGSSRPQETTGSSSSEVFSTSPSTSIHISLRGSDSPESDKTTSSSHGLSPSSINIVIKTTVPSESGETTQSASYVVFSTSPEESLKTIHGASGSPQPGDTTKSSSQSVSSTGPDSSVILKTTTESSSPRGARLTPKSFINGYSTNSISAETSEISMTTAESKDTTLDTPSSRTSRRAVTGSSVTNSDIGGGLVTTTANTITTAVTTGTTPTAASAGTTPSTTADATADSEEGTFPIYGQVLLGLLAAAFVVIPSVICLAANTNLLGRFS